MSFVRGTAGLRLATHRAPEKIKALNEQVDDTHLAETGLDESDGSLGREQPLDHRPEAQGRCAHLLVVYIDERGQVVAVKWVKRVEHGSHLIKQVMMSRITLR